MELDLTDPSVLHEVECFIICFEEEADSVSPDISLDKNFEVVFETSKEDPETNASSEGNASPSSHIWTYYVVDVEEKKVFWFHECIISREDVMRAGIGKEEHLRM